MEQRDVKLFVKQFLRDRPSSAGLLEAFADFYRTQVLPTLPRHLAYHGRVAANVLDIVRRELHLGGRADESELKSLQTLLQRGGDLDRDAESQSIPFGRS